MSAVHVAIHTRDDGLNVTVRDREHATWVELRSGSHSLTVFVKDVWELVSMADQIVQQVEEQIHTELWPCSISTEGESNS